mgnify:FL=1|tara:strand:- start:1777 stop:2007 length:231 start_codon:yes stop_codon:yes gene_type:complete
MSQVRTDQANAFRKERGYQGGYVVFYFDKISGWAQEFPRPQVYVADCIAVDEAGNEWVAKGGDDYFGAERWEACNG